MEKDKIFFGENGLTSTSANYIANIAKELYRKLEAELQNLTFYTTKVSLIGSGSSTLLREGKNSVANVDTIAKNIAGLKSLIAWLREAIKAKERLLSEAKDGEYDFYEIEVPTYPTCETSITEDDYIGTMSIKARNRYYYLEAYCVVLGNLIHPNGTYAEAREELIKIIHEPNEVKGSGRDTLLYSRTPSIKLEDVENTYMSLQDSYRSLQAELNAIKHQIKEAVEQDSIAKNTEFSKKLSIYRDAMKYASSVLSEKRLQKTNEISKYKIIIPDSLKGVYEMVQNVRKD